MEENWDAQATRGPDMPGVSHGRVYSVTVDGSTLAGSSKAVLRQ